MLCLGPIFIVMDQFVVIPGPRGDRFVELSQKSRAPQGRVFRKQILHYGDLFYPGIKGGKVKVDEAFADTLIANFSNGVADIVQVPKVGDNNEHTENPDRNIGEVIAVTKTAKGVYVDIDVRTADADKVGKTLLGASAMLSLDYTDTHTGQSCGPTLLHTAITNRPHVTNLDGFEEVIAASRGGADLDNQVLILSPAIDKENRMTPEEMIAALLGHGIDVAALQEKATQADNAVALSNKIQEELVSTGLLKLSGSDTVDADTLIGAVAEAGNKIVELSGRVDTLVETASKNAAKTEVAELVRGGFILPKDEDAQVELRLSNEDLFKRLLPEKPLVKLSAEAGGEVIDEAHEKTVDAEVARLSALAAEAGNVKVRS